MRSFSKWRVARRRMNGSATSFMAMRSEEHTSELQSLAYLVCRLLLEKKNINLLWSGTDDGLIHWTTDGGKQWMNVTQSSILPSAQVFFFEASDFHRNLHSFPTRRSSDLWKNKDCRCQRRKSRCDPSPNGASRAAG